MNKKIHPRGYWQADDINHYYDESFSIELNSIVSKYSSIVDFGCGNAGYAKYIYNNNKDTVVDAFDGNPNVKSLTGGFGKVLDLSWPFDLKRHYDVVICLEVAEHIPKKYEDIFLKNIINHCGKLLILSWANVGQGGKGHVNEQDEQYVVNKISDRNFTLATDLTYNLRKSATICKWFKNTIMVFKNEKNNNKSIVL